VKWSNSKIVRLKTKEKNFIGKKSYISGYREMAALALM
jgi:hypothetical protein